MSTVRRSIVIALLVFCTTAAHAASTETQTDTINPSCPDANVFSGKLISAIDWDNVYPIRIAGATLGGGEVPEGAAEDQIACACPDNNGMYRFGIQMGMWRPVRLIEVVRVANCSPAMGGTMIQSNTKLIGGPKERKGGTDDVHFYNVNVWAFPLTTMLELFTSVRCGPDMYMDIDLITLSTVDPTWNDDELSLMFSPEAFIFATPPALALQLADAASSAMGKPLNKAIGSAGAWGSMYPLSGNGLTTGSPPQISSLIGTKYLAKLHRIGFAKRSMGNDVMCGPKYASTLTKTQYRLSTFFPVPEISGDQAGITNKGYHVIGEPTFLWGEWRNRPGTGEDFLYIVWSWVDCCASKEGQLQ